VREASLPAGVLEPPGKARGDALPMKTAIDEKVDETVLYSSYHSHNPATGKSNKTVWRSAEAIMNVFRLLPLGTVALDIPADSLFGTLVHIEARVCLADQGGNRACIFTLVLANGDHLRNPNYGYTTAGSNIELEIQPCPEAAWGS